MKTEVIFLAHALSAVTKVTKDPNFKVYRMGRKNILPKVRELLRVTGVDLSRGGGIPELAAFQSQLSQFRIVEYSGLRSESVVFDGQITAPQRVNVLYNGQH